MQELDKSPASIGSMFSRIASRYDLLNRVLSFNSDRRWRARAVEELNGNSHRVLDLATGTGDFAIALSRAGKKVIGADFCLAMLSGAREKADLPLSAADALALPFPDASFDAVTVGWGVRNFADLGRGLAEMRRVIRPGGTVLILEFSQPSGFAGALYRFYSDRILPWIGGVLSGDRAAYRYLNRSARAWPGSRGMIRVLEGAGFVDIRAIPLAFGAIAIHHGKKP